MKTVCIIGLLAILLWSSAVAWRPFKFESEIDMLEYMRDEDHNIYVIFFYNTEAAKNSEQKLAPSLAEKERKLLRTNVVEQFPQIVYAELDLAGGKYDEVVHELGISVEDTHVYPTVVVVDDGIGKWVNGPNAYKLALPIVEKLAAVNPPPQM